MEESPMTEDTAPVTAETLERLLAAFNAHDSTR